jgi:ADP-ribosylglycohydrolase
MQPDGIRTHQKFDEARMLSEMAWYITHTDQPISMNGCMNFARLVIRECAQQMYKMIHHRKLVGEIKNQFNTIKNELRAIFTYQNNKVSITSDIWTADKHGIGYSCVTGYWIDDQCVLQKKRYYVLECWIPHTL